MRPDPLQLGNIYAGAQQPLEGERFDAVLTHKNLVIERIVSSSRITPTEYVQPQDEWVVLLRGDADLRVEEKLITLTAGDHLFLPARVPHTVLRVSDGAIWLAVHLHPDAEGEPSPSP